MKINDRCNTLWVVQYRRKVRKGTKKKPWRVFLLLAPSRLAVYEHREDARIVAAAQAAVLALYEFRPRRYADTGKA